MKINLKNILAMALIITMVVGNSTFVSAQDIETKAACSHTFSDWQYTSTSYKYPPVIGDCHIRVTRYVRVCSKCGEREYKSTDYQMEHNWIYSSDGTSKTCLNCNMTIGKVRMLNHQH